VTAIDAIGAGTVQVVLSEYGPDLSRFPSEKQFVQHATLAPHKPTSGGKALKKKKRNNGSTRGATDGSHIAAPQRDSAGRLLPPDCATQRQRHRGFCHGQEVGHAHLPPAPIWPPLRG